MLTSPAHIFVDMRFGEIDNITNRIYCVTDAMCGHAEQKICIQRWIGQKFSADTQIVARADSTSVKSNVLNHNIVNGKELCDFEPHEFQF